jgi:nucleoid-associated protein YgaU
MIIYLVVDDPAKTQGRTPLAGAPPADRSTIFKFPVTPERLSLDIEQRTEEFNLQWGSVIYPRGVTPETISFDSFFPDERTMSGDPTLVSPAPSPWRSPADWVALIRRWMKDRTPLRIRVTETAINQPVFVSRFRPDESGGLGNVPFSIEFREWIQTEIKPYATKGTQGIVARKRLPLTKPTQYLTKPGDTLVVIARRTLGDPTRWREIHALNRKLIPNPSSVASGLTIRIPRG